MNFGDYGPNGSKWMPSPCGIFKPPLWFDRVSRVLALEFLKTFAKALGFKQARCFFRGGGDQPQPNEVLYNYSKYKLFILINQD